VSFLADALSVAIGDSEASLSSEPSRGLDLDFPLSVRSSPTTSIKSAELSFGLFFSFAVAAALSSLSSSLISSPTVLPAFFFSSLLSDSDSPTVSRYGCHFGGFFIVCAGIITFDPLGMVFVPTVTISAFLSLPAVCREFVVNTAHCTLLLSSLSSPVNSSSMAVLYMQIL